MGFSRIGQRLSFLSKVGLLCCSMQSGVIWGDSSGTAEVLLFSPQGSVKHVHEIRATFSEPMVAFGDPRVSVEAFEVNCPEPGAALWSDAKNWSYRWDHDLPAGVHCSFKVKAGLKSLSGNEITGQKDFSFSTGGPAIQRSNPEGGNFIHEDQGFVLTLDSAADEASVLEHTHFVVEGIQEKIPAQIIRGTERRKILETLGHQFGKDPSGVARSELPELMVIQARRIFPPQAKVQLVWGAGIVSSPVKAAGAKGTAGVVNTPGVVNTQDQVLSFQVREDFHAKVICQRENPEADCIPFLPVSVHFSNEVPWSQAKRLVLKSADGKKWKPSHDQSGNAVKEDDDLLISRVTFKGPFPEKTEFKVEVPSSVKDDSNRKLSNLDQFPWSVRTDDSPPLAKFAASFGILESKPEALLPVTLRNLEPEVRAQLGISTLSESEDETLAVGRIARVPGGQIKTLVDWLSKVTEYRDHSQRGTSLLSQLSQSSIPLGTKTFKVKKPNGGKAFEVLGIPLTKPGFYVVELESQVLGSALLGKPQPMYVATAALVTNLAVHFKKGSESSAVWVTSLDQGLPVENAQVGVYDCAGQLLAQGRTSATGVLRIDGLPEKVRDCQISGSYSAYRDGIYVTAEKGADLSFSHSSWNNGIEPWRFNVPVDYAHAPQIVHTVFDRTLLRAGETVHMKHFVRRHTLHGFGSIPENALPDRVQISHQGTNQREELPLKWETGGGAAETTWTIPKDAKLGEYTVTLLKKDDIQWRSGEFRVEEFRVPLMKGTIHPPAQKQVSPKKVPVDLSVQYLAGGGADRLPVELRYQQSPVSSEEVPDFEGYTFSNGAVHERKASLDSDFEAQESSEAQRTSKLKKLSLILDKAGTERAILDGIQKLETPSHLSVELEFKDPNGEVQTTATSIPIYPSKSRVGIKLDSWFSSRKELKVSTAVVDLQNRPILEAPVEVQMFERKTFSHRKRLVGGFYAYEHRTEIKKVGKACGGNTDRRGVFVCEFVPPTSGQLLLLARSHDDAGNPSFANGSLWVMDRESWWFDQEDHDRIDLITERKRYEPGEKAVFQVRMPFREATAWVTVEREGILDSFVVPLTGQKPLVEVPIRSTYSPNVFVSVLVVRGRVGEVQPTATVDLGKPAYKIGMTEIQVGRKAHELKVQVSPDKEVYRVRDQALVKVHLETADGSPLPKNREVILAAVDEGLLELKPNESWNLLDAMMKRRSYEVQTSTAQMQVVGKRHFGLKALKQGGGGGRAPTRELFDTLLLWKTRILVDEKGNAEVEVPLNDSVTSFRIVAIAHSGVGHFGMGSASIRTHQELMIFSGIPPVVREGDEFQAELTLRNTTSDPMEVEVSGQVTGVSGGFEKQTVYLNSGESRRTHWKVHVPSGVDTLQYELHAQSVGSTRVTDSVKDRLKVSQKVIPAVPVRTFQATLRQMSSTQPEVLQLAIPEDALPGKGGVQVVLQPSLGVGLTGVSEYMKSYPYTCLEQKVSRAIALQDPTLWRQVLKEFSTHLDSDGLAKFFPISSLQGSDVLTSYLVAVAHEAGWEIPEAPRKRMIEGLKKFITGLIRRESSVPTPDLVLRKLAALEALSRHGEAAASMLGSLDLTPNLWPTSAVIDYWNILRRVKDIPGQNLKEKEAEQILRARLNFQGTRLSFSTEKMDDLWWLMISPETNTQRLLLSVLEESEQSAGLKGSEGAKWKEDIGRLVQGAVSRQVRGHWATTPGNAWGVLALKKFSGLFEMTPVQGKTEATLKPESQVFDWGKHPQGASLKFSWPEKQETLEVKHVGPGKPWVTVQSRAAIPLKKELWSGFRIQKTWTPVEQKKLGQWSKGDLVRVNLDWQSQAEMTWVVLNDPIPAGASILGTGLGNSSSLLTQGEKREGWIWPVFEERGFDSFRSYYEFVPQGKWKIQYTIRLNQAGKMNLPSTRIEAMYAPEMFGELPNPPVNIQGL